MTDDPDGLNPVFRAGIGAFLPLLGIVAFIIAAIILTGRHGLQPVPVDLHYFHLRTDAPAPYADIGYASIQVKSVAASRHVPVQDVRHLMAQYTINRDGPMIGRQRVDVPGLNLALDERWPMK